jgi:hypothetical protein
MPGAASCAGGAGGGRPSRFAPRRGGVPRGDSPTWSERMRSSSPPLRATAHEPGERRRFLGLSPRQTPLHWPSQQVQSAGIVSGNASPVPGLLGGDPSSAPLLQGPRRRNFRRAAASAGSSSRRRARASAAELSASRDTNHAASPTPLHSRASKAPERCHSCVRSGGPRTPPSPAGGAEGPNIR